MATKFQMQGKSSVDGLLYPWLADDPDYAGAGFPGPGTALDVAQYSGNAPTAAPVVPLSCAFTSPTTGPTGVSVRFWCDRE